MNSNVKQKWIAALKSGEYKQGRYKLREDDNYCCLGVLCSLYANDTDENCKWCGISIGENIKWYFRTTGENDRTATLPKAVIEWAELNNDDPEVVVEYDGLIALSKLNDRGTSFDVIAKLIDEQL